jgi:hypothetical protein
MANWILDHVRYEGRLVGGTLEGHRLCVSVCRSGRRNEYQVSVGFDAPRSDRMLYSGNSMRDASLNRVFTTPKAALDAGFKAAYRAIGESGKVTIENLTQEHASWVALNDVGMVDEKKTYAESAEQRHTKPFDYAPPEGPYSMAGGRDQRQGVAYKADVPLGPSEETSVRIGGREEKQDGLTASERARREFLAINGIRPLTKETDGRHPDKPLTGTGETGDPATRKDPPLPAETPSGY